MGPLTGHPGTARLRMRRAGRRHPAQRGLTLVELLIGLALMIVVTGFLAGGLVMARRAAEADAVSETATRTDAALEAAVDLLGTALPIETVAAGTKRAAVAFDGRPDGLGAIVLGDGRTLRGGLHKVTLRRDGDAVMVDVAPVREGADLAAVDPASVRHVVLLTGVRTLRVSYLGDPRASGAAPGTDAWIDTWEGAQRLPALVAVAVDFRDPRRQPVEATAVLRQR